ncbi:hypothetical protein AYO38_06700 [bacterium SCGC AG-212-C10]|nr:hypothetical protein AYO38_06700 [bacterium SCGC AG-212-C10]
MAPLPGDVLRRIHANHVDAFLAPARGRADWHVEVHGAATLIRSPFPGSAFNRLFVMDRVEQPRALIERAASLFRARRSDWAVIATNDAGGQLAPAARSAGLVPGSPLPLMAMMLPRIADGSERPAPALDVRRSVTPGDIRDFIATAAGGFGSGREVFEVFFEGRDIGPPECAFFVGYLSGARVASAAVTITNGVAGLQNIATLPVYRRRGIGEAMTRAALETGIAAGCDVAALTATPRGYPLYRRMGFADAGSYMTWDSP